MADFDKILVMGEGKTREFGSPRELLEKREGEEDVEGEEGTFKSMVKMSGEREELEKMILGGEGKV